MKNLKELLKDKEIKNLHLIKGGDDDAPIDRSKVKKPKKKEFTN